MFGWRRKVLEAQRRIADEVRVCNLLLSQIKDALRQRGVDLPQQPLLKPIERPGDF